MSAISRVSTGEIVCLNTQLKEVVTSRSQALEKVTRIAGEKLREWETTISCIKYNLAKKTWDYLEQNGDLTALAKALYLKRRDQQSFIQGILQARYVISK